MPAKNQRTKNRGVVEKREKSDKKSKKANGKKWLETPEDWARFEAWARENSEAKLIPEPEPVPRASKPLAELQKSIESLSKPQKKWESPNRSEAGVSKTALTARPSKRVLQLAKAVPKRVRAGKQFPHNVTRAALRYKASQRLIEISKPSVMPMSEHCKRLDEITRDIPSRKVITRRARFILRKKAIECPLLLTDEELDVLVTPTGVYRTALTYKFTPWMELLSLPSYKFLKDRKDDDAKRWKAYIIEESAVRGKKALEAKRKREERRKKIERKRERENAEKSEEEKGETEEAEKAPEDRADDEIVETKDNEEAAQSEDNEITEQEEAPEKTAEAKPADEHQRRDIEEKQTEKEDEGAARRRAERNAWRFAPPLCKKNPFAIKRSALKGKVSPRMAELAVRTLPKYIGCKKNPFAVKRSALTGPIPERVSILAKPNHPRDPIERPPPREKDSFGRPIYPMPPYGRKLPPRRKSKPAECPDKDKKDDDEARNKPKKRKIDPIAYEPTIDPCIDPERAKRQMKARNAAKEEMKKTTEAKEQKEPKREITRRAKQREEEQSEQRGRITTGGEERAEERADE